MAAGNNIAEIRRIENERSIPILFKSGTEEDLSPQAKNWAQYEIANRLEGNLGFRDETFGALVSKDMW